METEVAIIVASAIVAALGYLGKSFFQLVESAVQKQKHRRSQLVQLLSLLRAGRVAFDVQLEKRDILKKLVLERDPDLERSTDGFDKLFSLAFPNMSSDELELHSILRGITEHTIKPINEQLTEWLKHGEVFRARTTGHDAFIRLSEDLAELEAHLLLWHAKFQVWIPADPSRVFVFLDDEKRHGVGFPNRIQDTVREVLSSRRWIR